MPTKKVSNDVGELRFAIICVCHIGRGLLSVCHMRSLVSAVSSILFSLNLLIIFLNCVDEHISLIRNASKLKWNTLGFKNVMLQQPGINFVKTA